MSQAHANGPAGHTSAPPKAAQAGGKAFSNAAKKWVVRLMLNVVLRADIVSHRAIRDPALLPLALILGGAGESTRPNRAPAQ